MTGGVDYSFIPAMSTSCVRHLSAAIKDGAKAASLVWRCRARNFDATLPAGHGPPWRGTAFGGAEAARTPTIVDWYMEGKIHVDEMITHPATAEINTAFDLMHEEKAFALW